MLLNNENNSLNNLLTYSNFKYSENNQKDIEIIKKISTIKLNSGCFTNDGFVAIEYICFILQNYELFFIWQKNVCNILVIK